MRSEDLSPLFGAPPSVAVPAQQVSTPNTRSGTVLSFDPATGSTEILVDGVVMDDLAIDVVGAVPLKTGDIVRINTSDARWYVMGIVADPAPGVVPTWPADIAQAQADVAAAQVEIDAATAAVTELTDVTLPAVEVDVAAATAAVTNLTDVVIPALETELGGILPITETDISDEAITAPKIAANTITAAQIAAEAITASELAAEAVTAGKIAAGTIVAADIAADTITAAQMAAGAVTAAEIAAGAVTTPKLAAGAITADKISAGYVYTKQIAVEQLSGGSLTADILLSSTIRTADTGARVEIGPFGIVTYAVDNTPQTVLPSDAGGVNSFKGTVEASGATFTGNVAFRGPTEVSTGAVLTLASGVTAPAQAPTAVVDWESVALPASTSHGIGWVYKDSKWWTALWNGSAAYLVSYHETTGALVDLILLTGPDVYRPGGGLAWNGTYWYTVGQSLTDDNWYVLRWNTSGALQNGSVYTPISGTGWFYDTYTVGSMQIAYRASTGQLGVVEHDSVNQRFRVQYRDATTCATVSTTNTSVQAGFTAPPGGVAFGNFDYGSERMVVASRNSGSVWVFNPASSYAYSVTDSFPAAGGMITGLGWNGSAFFTARIFPDASSVFHKYTAIGKAWTPTAAENTWWGRFTWNNASPAYTTTPSPAVQFTMKKRARFTLTTPDLPTGADTVKTYVGVGATEPANTSRWLQGTDGRSQTFTTLLTSGSNPPTVGTFPDAGTPGKIQNSTGTLVISGDGTITRPADPYLYAHLNSDTGTLTASTWTNITSWTVDSSNSITNSSGLFTVNKAGRYRVSCILGFGNSSTGNRGITFVIDGVAKNSAVIPSNGSSTFSSGSQLHKTYAMTVGQTIRVQAWSSVALTVRGDAVPVYSTLDIEYVGP